MKEFRGKIERRKGRVGHDRQRREGGRKEIGKHAEVMRHSNNASQLIDSTHNIKWTQALLRDTCVRTCVCMYH